VYVVIPSGSRSVFVVSFHKPEKSHKVAAQQNLNILFSLNYINLYITTKKRLHNGESLVGLTYILARNAVKLYSKETNNKNT